MPDEAPSKPHRTSAAPVGSRPHSESEQLLCRARFQHLQPHTEPLTTTLADSLTLDEREAHDYGSLLRVALRREPRRRM